MHAAHKISLLDELRQAQAQWVDESDLSRLNPLARRIMLLADQLQLAHVEVFSGEKMSQARYDRLVKDIGYARNDLSRELTRQALSRAGL
jgi:hypothetical protein